MKIFVTNLKTSVDRRKSIETQFQRLGLEYEFFDCVVGADLSEEYLEQTCDMAKIARYNEKVVWFTRGIIGCTMTNQNICREIVARNLDYALLLEDDILITPDLEKVLQNIEPKIQQGDVILLFYMSWAPLQLKREKDGAIYKDYALHQPVDSGKITGGSAMIVTRKAAERMVRQNTPIHTTPDDWGYYLKGGSIDRLLCVYPYCIDTADFKSTMKTSRFNFLSDIVDKYRIPIFSQLLKWKRKKEKRQKQQITIVD